VGVFGTVVQIAVLLMFHTGQDLAHGRPIALQLIRDDHPRDIPHALQQFAEFHQVTFAEVWPAAALRKDTIFRGRVDFRPTKFKGLDLIRVTFHSGADFSGGDLGATVNVTNIDIERASLRMRWDQLLRSEGLNTCPQDQRQADRSLANKTGQIICS
jgi:hypothetical protein